MSAKGGSAVSLTPRERIAEHIEAIVLGCLAEAADYWGQNRLSLALFLIALAVEVHEGGGAGTLSH